MAAFIASGARSAPASDVMQAVEGLWVYTKLETSDGKDMPLTGIFLFKDGVFAQQAIFNGEPFEKQGSMAHAGPYGPGPRGIHLTAEQTISIAPEDKAALSYQHATQHEISVDRSGEALTIQFAGGTIQKFNRIGPGAGQLHTLENGVLAFVDGYFLLVEGDARHAVTGYGKFKHHGTNYDLEIIRWAETDGAKTVNRSKGSLKTTFDGKTFKLPDGRAFQVASGAKASPSAAPTSATQPLDALIEQYAAIERVHREESDELAEVSATAFQQEIESRRQLLAKVRQVSANGLAREDDIDRRLMIGLLESSIHTAEARRVWENDAALYVPAEEIGRALEPTAGSAQERATALTSLLEKVPARLEEGRRNLVKPPRSYTEAAVFKTEGTIKLLRSGGPALAKEAGGAGSALSTASTKALTSLDAYLKFLKGDLLPRSTGSWVLGKENYDYVLQHRWMMQTDADTILARGQQSFKETEALAQEVARRIDPRAKSWIDVYEKIKNDYPAADGIKQAYQAKIDAARAFVIEHRIVSLPAGERVITIDTPPAMRRSSPFGTFQSVDAFGTGLEGKLVLTPIEDWMTPAQREERLRAHHNAWIPIIAVHEAYPGHHVDGLKRQQNPRLLRKVVSESIMSEGWGLFTEEMMYEQGFLKGDDVRLTQLRNRLWRAARVILDVSLHTGRMSFDEAVTFLADKVRFDRYAAGLDVGMYTQQPTYVLGYLIGMQEIAAIRADYVKQFGEPSPPSEFYDRLLSVGSIPPALVREITVCAQDRGDGRALKYLDLRLLHAEALPPLMNGECPLRTPTIHLQGEGAVGFDADADEARVPRVGLGDQRCDMAIEAEAFAA